MRILFATTAGEGHFGPLVPFARAAVAAGHEVAVAAPASFRSSVESTGLPFLPFGDVPGDVIGSVMSRLPALSRIEANELVVGEIFGRIDTEWALPRMREIFRDFRPDVVVREPVEFSSAVVATETSTRSIIAAIGVEQFDDYARLLVRDPLAEFGVTDDSAVWDVPRVSLLPAAFDDPETVRKVHRFRESPAAVSELPDWWPGNDAPLVYVTFGSVAATMGLYPRLYRSALEQLAELDIRVLMTVGRAADPAALGPLPANAHVEQWVPQAGVLAAASASVGHGGFGTTLGTIAAGVPTVVMPLFASDQYMNAERVTETGAGIGLAGLESPADDPGNAGDLAAAVRTILDHPEYRSRAEQLAMDIAALPPISGFPTLLEST